jgi:hypothetical protein
LDSLVLDEVELSVLPDPLEPSDFDELSVSDADPDEPSGELVPDDAEAVLRAARVSVT